MERRVTIWHRDRLFVQAVLTDAGDLAFEGQDLNGWLGSAEYEYWVRAPAAAVPRIVAALGGAPGADVLGLLVDRAQEIVTAGESTWLHSLGIEPEIVTHTSD